MTVTWHMLESRRAARLASNGAYEEAARLAAQSAHARFRAFGLESLSTNSNLAVGDLLDATCYARQAGADERAIHLRGTVEAYTRVIRECAHCRLREEWPSMT